MDRYFGFDLGDAESSIARLNRNDKGTPEILAVREAKSFITAYARLKTGEIVIGESACWTPGAVERKLRFKSTYLTNPDSQADIRTFAAAVLGELYRTGDLIKNEDCCFYIGCPAGWGKNDREHYREIFERVGYPPLKIISESRAALISACQSKHLQVGYDILSKPVLVVDMGSSTTDFAYITNGKEVELQTAGEVFLGDGIMDEILLQSAVEASPHRKRIEDVFSVSQPWKNYCEFTARRLKEKYFSDEEYWKSHRCSESVVISYKTPVRLKITMSPELAEKMVEQPAARLNGKSFHAVFTESLQQVREKINGDMPELLFLTGGVSKLPAVRAWCEEAFPEAVVITGAEPEFSVSRGLAWSGSIDEELRQFKKEVRELIESSAVQDIVKEHIDDFYHTAVDALVGPVLEHAALPAFERWRSGEIKRLEDIDNEMQKDIAEYLHSDEARELLVRPISDWLKPVAAELEKYTVPICMRHNVPYTALSLSSYFSYSDVDIHVDAKDVLAMEEITWMINGIISLLVGLLCGGGGAAIVANGISGVLAGIVISLVVLLVGKEPVQAAIMHADIPVSVRKLVRESYVKSRLQKVSSEVKANFYEKLETEKNDEISEHLADDISHQIEACLTKMAEVVEIPLG